MKMNDKWEFTDAVLSVDPENRCLCIEIVVPETDEVVFEMTVDGNSLTSLIDAMKRGGLIEPAE